MAEKNSENISGRVLSIGSLDDSDGEGNFYKDYFKNADKYITSEITNIPNVKSVHGLHVWSVSSSEVFLSCHICTEEDMLQTEADSIIKSINSMLADKFSIRHTTIQVEADVCQNDSDECCS